jgi:hypothetical protein
MTKRQRFVTATVIVTCLLIGATLVSLDWRYRIISVLAIAPVILTAWSLREAWKGVSRLTSVILPMMFGVGAGFFTFLLPEVVSDLWIFSWGTAIGKIVGWGLRVGFWVIFSISFYALLLTENIYSVSAIRTIALARAANAVGFLLTLITGFFLYNATWSFRLPFYWNGLWVFIISFILFLPGLWAAKMADKISLQIIISSIVLAIIIGQIAIVMAFWPVNVAVGSLVTTSFLYVLLGLYQQELLKRLFKRTIWEYLSVGLAVLAIVTITTRWGG